jgi:hypothetical protein
VAALLSTARKQHRIDQENADTAVLTVGENPGFTLPIPVARNKQAQSA